MAPFPGIRFVYLCFKFVKKREDIGVECNHEAFKRGNFLEGKEQWAHDSIEEEIQKYPPFTEFCFTEWQFRMRNRTVFEVLDMFYTRFVLILGYINIHWYYHPSSVRVFVRCTGNADLIYCPCCIDNNIEKFVADVKEFIWKQVTS